MVTNIKKNKYIWEDIWQQDPYAISEERSRRASNRIGHFKDLIDNENSLGRVVEFGCGDGSLAKLLLSDEVLRLESYLGIDKSFTAIDRAKSNLQNNLRASFINSDILDVDLENFSADTVIACGVLEHIEDVESVLRKIQKICVPGGIVILTMSNTLSTMFIDRRVKELLGVWRYGYQKNYYPHELENLIGNYLTWNNSKVVHGDWDYKIVATLDRLGSILFKTIGRYIILTATPLVLSNMEKENG